jgi:hypothetical protein
MLMYKLLGANCNRFRQVAAQKLQIYLLPTVGRQHIILHSRTQSPSCDGNSCPDLRRVIYGRNLVPRASDPLEGTWGSGIIRFREESDWPLIWNAQFDLSHDSWLPATDYPRASRSFPRIAGSGNEIDMVASRDFGYFEFYDVESRDQWMLDRPTHEAMYKRCYSQES